MFSWRKCTWKCSLYGLGRRKARMDLWCGGYKNQGWCHWHSAVGVVLWSCLKFKTKGFCTHTTTFPWPWVASGKGISYWEKQLPYAKRTPWCAVGRRPFLKLGEWVLWWYTLQSVCFTPQEVTVESISEQWMGISWMGGVGGGGRGELSTPGWEKAGHIMHSHWASLWGVMSYNVAHSLLTKVFHLCEVDGLEGFREIPCSLASGRKRQE